MPQISDLFRVLDGDAQPSAELRLGKVLPTIERYWNKRDFGAVRREALEEIERFRPVLRGFFFGQTAVAEGDPQQAAQRLQHYLADLHRHAASAFRRDGALEEARQHLLRAVVLLPEETDRRLILIENYEECGEYWAALTLMERELAGRPELCLRLFQLGASIHSRGASSAAALCFEKAREHDDVGLIRELAELRLKTLEEHPPKVEALESQREESIQALQKGELDNAFRGFMDVLSWFPDNGETWFGIGYLLQQRMGGHTTDAAFARAGIVSVFRETSRDRQDVLRRACQAYWLAVATKPELAEAHHQLANCYQELGTPALALAPAQRAAELSPRDAGVLADLGTVLLALNEFAEAETVLRAALEIDPLDIVTLLSLAQTLEGAGNFEEAAAYRHLVDHALDELKERK
jgi:tetratricopeptide (TPR) repeat protein